MQVFYKEVMEQIHYKCSCFCSSIPNEQDVVDVGNGIYDQIWLSSLKEPEEESDDKYDLSNPTYEEGNYSLACPVYEDVVGAVEDYEVAIQNTNRSSTLEESIKFDDEIYCALKWLPLHYYAIHTYIHSCLLQLAYQINMIRIDRHRVSSELSKAFFHIKQRYTQKPLAVKPQVNIGVAP